MEQKLTNNEKDLLRAILKVSYYQYSSLEIRKSWKGKRILSICGDDNYISITLKDNMFKGLYHDTRYSIRSLELQ